MTDPLPTLPGDRTLELLTDAYRFVGRHTDALGTDGFRARITGRRAVCLRGAEAARFFYEGDRFTRTGAIPAPVRHLLQDDGSVQTLDGAAHRHRKSAFLDVLDDPAGSALVAAFDRAWERSRSRRTGVVVDARREAVLLLGDAALDWVGVPVDGGHERVIGELESMFEHAGRFGPSNLVAQARRSGTERRAREWIRRARTGEATGGSPLAAVAAWTGEDGAPLPVPVAAVELLNLLRPVVAVADFLVWAALALAVRPALAGLVRERPRAAEAISAEVRRHAPFFPLIAGRALGPLEWRGVPLPERAWVLLDLYGTNHDRRLWPDPQRFRPERFLDDGASPGWIVGQGAGEQLDGHRCPGEPATAELVARFTALLAASGATPAAPPDARVRFGRIPALPARPVLLRLAAPEAPAPH